MTTNISQFLGFSGVSNRGTDLTFIILATLLCVAVLALAIWLLTKYIRRPKYAESYKAKLEAYDKLPQEKKDKLPRPQPFSFLGIWFAIMGAGVIIRLLFVFFIRGFRPEIEGVADIFFYYTDPRLVYATNSFSHYPIITYIYAFFGVLARAMQLDPHGAVIPLFVKLPLVFADIALMAVVYVISKKHINEYTSLIMAGIVAFFPPFIMLSSIWGSVYSIAILLLVLTFYFIASRKLLGVFITYSLALLTSRSALLLFPVVATFIIFQFVKSILYIRRNKIDGGLGAIIKDAEAKNVFFVPLFFVASWLFSWLLVLPLIHNLTVTPWGFVNLFFISPLANMRFFGFNSMGIFNFFVDMSGNGAQWTASGGMTALFVVLFGAIITGLVVLVYLTRKNRALLVFVAGYVYLTLSIFFIDFGATNLIVVTTLFLLAFIFIRDKRILLLAAITGTLLTLNMSFVMLNAGFLNNLPYYYFAGPEYVGEILLGYSPGRGAWLAINIILSVLAILTFIYATVVMLDIAMSSKRKLISATEKPSFFGAVGKFFRAK